MIIVNYKYFLDIRKNGLPNGELISGDFYDENENYDFLLNQYCKGYVNFIFDIIYSVFLNVSHVFERIF